MKLFYTIFLSALLFSAYAGCATPPSVPLQEPTLVDEFGEVDTKGAPLPFGYETWPAKVQFSLLLANGSAVIVEVYGRALDQDTLKVLSLIEIKPSDKKERRLWYYTITDSTISNVYAQQTTLYTRFSNDPRAVKPEWTAFNYLKVLSIVNNAMKRILGFNDAELASFHLLYIAHVSRAMFQITSALEPEDGGSEMPSMNNPKSSKEL